jgi:hypothetical protein
MNTKGLSRKGWVGILAAVAAVLVLLPMPATARPADLGTRLAAPVAVIEHRTNGIAYPTSIHHVIQIWFENKELGQVLRQKAPYEHTLAQTYALAGQFYSVRHGSEPDYLAGTSAINKDTYLVGGYSVKNVGDLVRAKGMTWGSYFDGMPYACDPNVDWTTGYQKTHNPFVQYHDVWDNQTYCKAHVQTLSAWNATVKSGKIPNYVLIVPSLFHDQHSGTIGAGSTWLQDLMRPIVSASWFSSTAVIVTYDEGQPGSPAGFNSSFGGNIYTVVVSPYAHMAYNSSHPYQTYSLLTTTEWLLGLGRTYQNDNWTLYPPMRDMFSFTSDPKAAPYTITGTVIDTATGKPIGGAHVVAADKGFANGADTNSLGDFTIRVNSGTFHLYVTAYGFKSLVSLQYYWAKNVYDLDLTLAPV